jgi:hypothetical protein
MTVDAEQMPARQMLYLEMYPGSPWRARPKR